MIENAIMHMPESRFCFAVSQSRVRLRLRISSQDAPDKIEVVYGGKYDFANVQNTMKMKIIAEDRLYIYYGTELELSDKRLAYIFKIYEGNKVSYYSEDGLTDTYDFELNYYNCFQYAYLNDADIHYATDGASEAVFYQIFVDRFHRGRSDKDISYINIEWGDMPTPNSFAGGDLFGICEKLDYIKSLGVNYIYLTPVFHSSSNHKYDTKDYYRVDGTFGGEEALVALVEKAHSLGMKVVLDAVFNHLSEANTLFEDVLENGKSSKFADWLIKKQNGNGYECFASCEYMPKLNTSNPDTRKYLIDIARYWTEKLCLDGWRLDVSDEVSHTFWRELRSQIKKINKNCILIGENWHDASSYLGGDQFDSIMNYALTKALLDYFAFDKLNSIQLAQKLNELLMRNTDTVNSMMLNLLDSHDTHRFLTRVNGDKSKLMCALAVLYFYPGMPCIYYGTENAMEGAYDPDSRRCFDWSLENENNEIKDLIKMLSNLKKDSDFSFGEFSATSQDELLILERVGEKKTYRLSIDKVRDYSFEIDII